MSSSASTSSSQLGRGGRRRRGRRVVEGSGDGDGGQRRRGRPSSSSSPQQPPPNGFWPEPFVEALALQVAIDAVRTSGRLAAAPAIANVFQVCSTWRAVSHSNHLWQDLSRRIWRRQLLLRETWRDEFIFWHRTAHNFRIRRAVYTRLEIDDGDSDGNGIELICRRLALSNMFLACGFVDGSVRLFDLSSGLHVSTYRSHHDDRLGRFSRAVSGIVINDDPKVVFATMDGDVHVAIIGGADTRRAQEGNVVNDGALVDFAGCRRWWVGLYAGVPGRAFHVWDGVTEELLYVGGTLTDPEAVMGWHMLTEWSESLGRVRVSSLECAVACTSVGILVLGLRDQLVLGSEEFEEGLIVDSFDVSGELCLLVDSSGTASVRRVGNMEEVYGFRLRGGGGGGGGGGRVLGCINGGYVFLCIGGTVRVWDVEHGRSLYHLRERIREEARALIADERYVAACSGNTQIHLWDFGAL
ncbi:transcriptional regulator STERILE APETALA [Telopea speciosissima]|uniref:transcriptional regulator STERILE APETALA n=1 Tax=Telopea speciosissima TaxID=54955 RepID=UPI001CC50210|nr:transcriptional regulator STERILE APETALA [Telopea speciosissima]